jgi:serine/threonine protein kinase
VTAKDFTQISVIGKGSYGKVLLVQKKDTGKRYALKILKKEEIIKRN